MNSRERFIKTFNFEETDRPFYWETPGVWPATIKRWLNEGFPESEKGKISDFFGMDKLVWLKFPGGWTKNPYCPMFSKEIVDEDESTITAVDNDGIIKKQKKEDPDTSMPQFLKFPVETKEDYYEKIKPRINYESKDRFPENWDDLVKQHTDRDYTLGMFIIGPFGYIRNLFGDENLMYLFYDDPDFVHAIMKDWQYFYRGFIGLVTRDIVPDFVMVWEDICYNMGPLISPEIFSEFMKPYLKNILSLLKEKDVKGIIVDTDGDCSKMLPVYLECGANGFYPFEVQAGMDIVDIRKEYKNSFVIIGGLDKKTLAKDKESIMAEVDKKVPYMLSQKGYIPMLDHTVPPDVPYENFNFFLEYVRKYK